MADKNVVNHKRLKEVLAKLWTKANEKFIETIEFVEQNDSNDGNKQKKKIKFIKGDDSEIILDPFLVTEWKDLQYTTKRDIATLNLLDYGTKITGKCWTGNKASAILLTDENVSFACVDVEQGSDYTIFKSDDDSQHRHYFLAEDNTVVDASGYSVTQEQGWQKTVIPAAHLNGTFNGKTIKKLAVHFNHNTINSNGLMVFKGNKTLADTTFIPYTGEPVLIDSKEVSLSYSSDNNILSSKTIHGAIDELSVKGVKTWDDLDYTSIRTSAAHKNLYDKNSHVIDNAVYTTGSGNNPHAGSNQNYYCAFVPCKAGRTYTIIKTENQVGGVTEFNAFGVFDKKPESVASRPEPLLHIKGSSLPDRGTGNYHVFVITIPATSPLVQDQECHLAINLLKTSKNKETMMVFENDIPNAELPTGYIPHYDGEHLVFIDGNKVELTFNNQSLTLTSETISDAIRELDTKKVSLNAQGKIDFNLIPEVVLNDFHSVQNEAEALRLVQDGTIKTGDVIIRKDNNSLYMYMGRTHGNFSDFAEITVSTGTLKTVNGQPDDGNGNVTINATHIQATVGGTGNTVQAHMQNMNTNIENVNSRVTAQEARITTNANDIANLKAKHPTRHAGEIITTYRNLSDPYTEGGVTYVKCSGRATTQATYPQLAAALGKTGTFTLPYVADVNDALVGAYQRTYIVAQVD